MTCFQLAVLAVVLSLTDARSDLTCLTIPSTYHDAGIPVSDCVEVTNHYPAVPVYLFRLDQKLDWQGAQTACAQVTGGNLASILNTDEFSAAVQLVNSLDQRNSQWMVPAAWIGMKSTSGLATGPWEWTDGQATDYATQHWVVGEPDQDNTPCVAFTLINPWHVDQQTIKHNYNPGFMNCACDAQGGMQAICKI